MIPWTRETLSADVPPMRREISSIPRHPLTVQLPTHTKANLLFISLLAVYAAYAGIFIVQSSFIVEGQRYCCLLDDAMVSMRYAANLAAGKGLCWNPGEPPVEGFTNPLWTLWMALWHRLIPNSAFVSLAIQISGAMLLGVNLWLVWRIASICLKDSWWATFVPVLWTAFCYRFNFWGLLGMETCLLAALTTGAAFWALQGDKGSPGPWPGKLLAVATWVRMDMAIPALVMAGYRTWRTPGQRFRVAGDELGVLTISLGIQTLLRRLYFGEWLPNTFFLKMTGYPVLERLARGWAVMSDFIGQAGWLIVLVPLLFAGWRAIRERDHRLALPAGLIFGQAAYSVYVGGDAWEWIGGCNRYMAIVMPLLFVLLAVGGTQLLGDLGRRVRAFTRPGPRLAFGLVLTAVCLYRFNVPEGRYPVSEWLLLRPPVTIENHQYMVNRAVILRRFTRETTRIGVVWAGIIPYFSGRPAVDFLGKSDPVIAREPMHRRPFFPGHLKWNYAYSIGNLKPDVITQLWWIEEGRGEIPPDYIQLDRVPPDATPFIVGHYQLIKIAGEPYLLRMIGR